MIQRALRQSPPFPTPLQREEYDEQTARRNKTIRFRHAISNVPYEIAQIVHMIQYNKQQERMCKIVLNRKHIPFDLFQHIDTYLYDVHYKKPTRLHPKGFSRAVHHLIHIERISDIDGALTIGKQFDAILNHRNASNFTKDMLIREFRESLWSYMRSETVTPEMWYPDIIVNDFTVWCV
jgi:hypothetical protein